MSSSMPGHTCTSPAASERGYSSTSIILGTVELPEYREDDPRPGRERFCRQNALNPGRWLRVVADVNDDPGRIVTVLIQDNDPREQP